MTSYKIFSGNLQASISTKGAELTALKLASLDHNWIWSAQDPWRRSAPHLFPIVGKLKNDRWSHTNRTYSLGQHGFSRDLEFVLISQTEQSLHFRLSNSELTLPHYPFAFDLDVSYKIEDDTLRLIYQVTNRDSETIYFNIGWHPAFVLPGQNSDGSLTLEAHPPLKDYLLLQEGLLENTQHSVPPGEPSWSLYESTFSKDALIFLNASPQIVTLKGLHGASVTLTSEAPHFGLWTKDLSKFICLEPWWGYADAPSVSEKISEKPGIQHLAPQKTWSTTLTLQLQAPSSTHGEGLR